MSTTNLVLLVWATACLGVAYAFGSIWKTAKFWKWVDPVYYPLAILGIALLFFSNQNVRALADLRDELADTEQLISDLKATQPPPNVAEAVAASRVAEQARLDATRKTVEGKIASMQKGATITVFDWVVSFLVSHFWPFVLVFALALKFAKGVAAS